MLQPLALGVCFPTPATFDVAFQQKLQSYLLVRTEVSRRYCAATGRVDLRTNRGNDCYPSIARQHERSPAGSRIACVARYADDDHRAASDPLVLYADDARFFTTSGCVGGGV